MSYPFGGRKVGVGRKKNRPRISIRRRYFLECVFHSADIGIIAHQSSFVKVLPSIPLNLRAVGKIKAENVLSAQGGGDLLKLLLRELARAQALIEIRRAHIHGTSECGLAHPFIGKCHVYLLRQSHRCLLVYDKAIINHSFDIVNYLRKKFPKK